jgi:hypothetical protein
VLPDVERPHQPGHAEPTVRAIASGELPVSGAKTDFEGVEHRPCNTATIGVEFLKQTGF